MPKKKEPVAPAHNVGDEIWFAWIGYQRPFCVQTRALKVKAVGPLQSTLEDYPPWECARRWRGKSFDTGTKHPSSRDEAVGVLLASLRSEKDDLEDALVDLNEKIAAVGGA